MATELIFCVHIKLYSKRSLEKSKTMPCCVKKEDEILLFCGFYWDLFIIHKNTTDFNIWFWSYIIGFLSKHNQYYLRNIPIS